MVSPRLLMMSVGVILASIHIVNCYRKSGIMLLHWVFDDGFVELMPYNAATFLQDDSDSDSDETYLEMEDDYETDNKPIDEEPVTSILTVKSQPCIGNNQELVVRSCKSDKDIPKQQQ